MHQRCERAAGQVRPPSGPNTGYQDALGVLVRLLQRGQLSREEVEEVIAANCHRQGRPVPDGTSMQRRMERLRGTFAQSGVALQAGVTEGCWAVPDWRPTGVEVCSGGGQWPN